MEAINIVGGGIAGLALAAGLDPERYDVTVHEQRPGLPTVETSLAMWPEAQGALAVLGILPEIKAVGATFGGMALRDAAGGSWASPEVRAWWGCPGQTSSGSLTPPCPGACAGRNAKWKTSPPPDRWPRAWWSAPTVSTAWSAAHSGARGPTPS